HMAAMKHTRRTAFVLALCMALALTGPAPALALTEAGFGYENPQDIIICRPDDGYTTTNKSISILGACDYHFPLYMNGKEIDYTEHGFFTEYVDLELGLNTFTFTNNGKTKVINVTRRASAGSSSGGSAQVSYWGSWHKAQYLTADNHNSSRISSPDSDLLLSPLASGTVSQITGETDELYRLADGSFVYKTNMIVSDGVLPLNTISAASIVPETEYGCTELRLTMSQNTLYNMEVGESGALLTLYNTAAGAAPVMEDNRILQYVAVTEEDPAAGRVVYYLKFHEDAPLNGYYVEFSQGVMKVGFQHLPRIKGNSLEGVRIHLDPGHGGTDSGAVGPADSFGPIEKDINLNMALYARNYLESKGATVIMTREDDTGMALKDRAARVAYLHPHLSFSFHCNSVDISADYNRAAGFRTYYSYPASAAAAEHMNDTIAELAGIGKTSVYQRNLAMTRMTGYPAVLTESKFMSNPQDYEWLISRENQEAFGTAAGKAIESWILQTAEQDISVLIDGEELDNVHPPVIREGRTLVPLRAIFEALGASVDWDAATQTVTASAGEGARETTVVLSIGGSEMELYRGGRLSETLTLDVAACLIGGRTFVPARAVSEALGAAVDWDAAAQTVLIKTGE
ncbi:MAG: N-acetylmuramoyl-L-alanine amidase, partial [Bacillota bacterium]|nr:N-acetylmuramoyl-L-alanine amidase [Bacillota bacterium]